MVCTWDPEWNEFAKTMGQPPSLPEDLKQVGPLFNDMLISLAERLPPPTVNVSSEDVQITGGGPDVRTYSPVDGIKLGARILFCHGGGWFCGNLKTEDRTCRMVCGILGASVVSVDYRCDWDVSLEDQVVDCYAAFEWMAGRTRTEHDKVVIWGGSAGGALAAAVVYRAIEAGKDHHIAGLCSMNGLHLHPDATPEKYKALNTSYVDNAGPLPFVSGNDTLALYQYRAIEPPNTDISIFPAAGGPGAVTGFPPTYIITSDNDASRDDGTVFEAVLKDAGVKVKRDNIKGLAHYFWIFDLPKANADFWSKLCDGIAWTLSQ